MKQIFITLITMTAILFSANGAEVLDLEFFSSDEFIERQLPSLGNVNWKVGDFQERQISKGSSFKVGTLYSWVDSDQGTAIWLMSDLKIIFKKKQKIEMLIEKKTGKILKYIVDGEEKNPPDVAKVEECDQLSEVNEKVKVPAGSFNTLRTIAQCEEDEILALWVNDKEVNMGGHIRQAQLDEKADPKKPKYLVELVKFGNK